jgi:hypothetical protein
MELDSIGSFAMVPENVPRYFVRIDYLSIEPQAPGSDGDHILGRFCYLNDGMFSIRD